MDMDGVSWVINKMYDIVSLVIYANIIHLIYIVSQQIDINTCARVLLNLVKFNLLEPPPNCMYSLLENSFTLSWKLQLFLLNFMIQFIDSLYFLKSIQGLVCAIDDILPLVEHRECAHDIYMLIGERNTSSNHNK